MKQKITALLLTTLFGIVVVAQPVSAAVTNQSIAVPMYEYPTVGTFWDDITNEGGDTVPFVIVNPASGPGTSVDSTYTAEIAENTAGGIRSVAYVYSNYQDRPWQEVYDDIDDWYQMYPGISGIFIDLVETGGAAEVCYIATLYNHIKSKHPNDLVILNPGTNISSAYEPYGDIFLNAENTYAAYQSSWSVMHPGFEDNQAFQNRFWHILHTVDSADYTAARNLLRANNAGWIYITDDVMPNPYKVTPSYWATEVSDIDAMPASEIPNRGKTALPNGCTDLETAATNTVTTSAKTATTASNISIKNKSTVYKSEASTTVSFSLPNDVSFIAGSGTGWSCNTSTKTCTLSSDVPANQTAAVLSTNFSAGCSYSSGSITATVNNFAANTWSLSIPINAPSGCVESSTTSKASKKKTVEQNTTVAVDSTPDPSTNNPLLPDDGDDSSGDSQPEVNDNEKPDTEPTSGLTAGLFIGGSVLMVAGGVFVVWRVYRRRL